MDVEIQGHTHGLVTVHLLTDNSLALRVANALFFTANAPKRQIINLGTVTNEWKGSVAAVAASALRQQMSTDHGWLSYDSGYNSVYGYVDDGAQAVTIQSDVSFANRTLTRDGAGICTPDWYSCSLGVPALSCTLRPTLVRPPS
jgi:hypothetical protein